ncbi:hypothetical protein MMC25_002246, partial [Agyrium rufum]|nr:hypothetical protein [Agyrium rufum]
MAFDLLSVPSMAAETECMFSQIKLILASQRQRLTLITFEALQLLKSWDREGILAAQPVVKELMIKERVIKVEEMKPRYYITADDSKEDSDDVYDLIERYNARPA